MLDMGVVPNPSLWVVPTAFIGKPLLPHIELYQANLASVCILAVATLYFCMTAVEFIFRDEHRRRVNLMSCRYINEAGDIKHTI